ncbi:MAG: hypothetical protein WDM90_17050 [Ferruginibacter sp.]
MVGSYEAALDPLPAVTITEIQNNQAIIHIKWTQQVEYFMAVANHFVFPSHREGFPNVLFAGRRHATAHYMQPHTRQCRYCK